MSIEYAQREVWIRGTGDYREPVEGDTPPRLKTLVQESLGVPVRRIGRFIQLALIGAGRCAGRARAGARHRRLHEFGARRSGNDAGCGGDAVPVRHAADAAQFRQHRQ
ncbi:MAG: hypothetical protein U5K73_08125 [Halofilum sp. (in: g-proteobacteria)]|nr:hypothetical protein [Halofilum sp. (in: g-proteobacteria)]